MALMPKLDDRTPIPRWRMLMPAMVALAFLPVLLAPVPGFVDMPSHMARHHVLANIMADPALSRIFAVHWQWIANLGADLPSVLLAPLLGSERATLVVGALLAPLTVMGLFQLSRAAHGRVSASAFVALPFAMHQAWMWGFLNYCMGIGLALLVAAWLYTRPRESGREQVILAVAALVVWTAHMASWVVLLILAAGNELGKLGSWREVWPAMRPNLVLLVPVVPLLLWRSEAAGHGSGPAYVDFVNTKIVVFASVLRGTDKLVDIGLLAALACVSGVALLWASGRRLERRLLVSGVLLAFAAVAAPTTILNAWGTDLRTAPIALLVLVLAITPSARPERERLIVMAGIALFCVRVGTVTRDWVRHGHVLEQRLTLLGAVPRGGRVGYLWAAPDCGFPWRLVPDEKLGSYALTRRDAYVNTLFMVDNAKLMTVRDPLLAQRWSGGTQDVAPLCPQNRPDLAAMNVKIAGMRADGFDAVWVSGGIPADLPPPPGFVVAKRAGGDTLFVRR
ncbi:hypothetical protein [Novosphingobium resinovorum]|uniref:hypothetical protein n=2 Tax=Sphingomonadaceae TaxID=41297 RepID=UPI0022F299E0|nr:hypothetical protein [Novosphingobium resinovorum]GLK42526.1 hypothetical protein GCM10017612_04430 [Novosphingobium resinovorum]